MIVETYKADDFDAWNDFCELSKTDHFFFNRKFMEYHSDRFEDFSLLIYEESGALIGLLPANRDKDVVFTHQGLTFGGLIVGPRTSATTVCEMFGSIKSFLIEQKIVKLVYKAAPNIYRKGPNDEDLYALFVEGAQLVRRDLSSAIILSQRMKYSKGKKYNISKARKHSLDESEESDFSDFWDLLELVLSERHQAKPVHSLAEINSLKKLFPNNIKLYTVRIDGEITCGVVLFITDTIVHTQYMASSLLGREIGALDLLIDSLIKSYSNDKDIFDFGISTEQSGRSLNQGLLKQKEGFGARGIAHDFYEWKLK